MSLASGGRLRAVVEAVSIAQEFKTAVELLDRVRGVNNSARCFGTPQADDRILRRPYGNHCAGIQPLPAETKVN